MISQFDDCAALLLCICSERRCRRQPRRWTIAIRNIDKWQPVRRRVSNLIWSSCNHHNISACCTVHSKHWFHCFTALWIRNERLATCGIVYRVFHGVFRSSFARNWMISSLNIRVRLLIIKIRWFESSNKFNFYMVLDHPAISSGANTFELFSLSRTSTLGQFDLEISNGATVDKA